MPVLILITFLSAAYIQQVDVSTKLLDDANRQALSHSVAAPASASSTSSTKPEESN